ncbi:MAG: tRNA (N(6)-L-threonylcarbamoyladenosine(37)-C(2))-methylthiotransferase MtaB [Actinomycetota bacterium]
MPKVSFYTLGCKVNQAETEEMLASFAKAGFEWVDSSEEADVRVVNTCTVTKEADRKSRQAIRRAVQNRGNGDGRALVVVTGCYAEISPEEVCRIPGVDLVVSQSEKDKLVEKVIDLMGVTPEVSISQDNCGPKGPPLHCSGRPLGRLFSSKIPRLRTRAFLKIQDGCNNFCSYCIVPFARGRERSQPYKEIVTEAQELVRGGVKEIVLTGVHLGRYREDEKGLADLLRDISKIPDVGRIRLSSLEPEEVTSELVSLIRESGKVCRHLHLPLQSGDDGVLKAMRRNYTTGDFVSLVSDIKREIPGVAVTTDVMVGFPGETDEQFNRTKELCEKLEFARLHVFKYSPRVGTAAAKFADQVSEEVKHQRSQILIDLGERLAWKFRERFIGRKMDVLVEKKTNGKLTGLTDNYIRVCFDGPETLMGQIVSVKLLNNIGVRPPVVL